ncbi:TniQ family protein [Duganella sp. 3397]|uniref:TniQ family protein n=1 Tax=Duganella sp. 3397 TaxID=2817732 RepID=UPI003857802B
MRRLSSTIWPIHYKPLPDELLSCWLVRLAHGHGMKAQTFCNVIFGSQRQIWNRDIDRLAPKWLMDELTNRTGTPPEIVFKTTLRAYEGTLYRRFRSAGPLHCILVLQMYHRKRNGYGLQFCPQCLGSDSIPYFRKQWRIALNTVCTTHRKMLLDRCSSAGRRSPFID